MSRFLPSPPVKIEPLEPGIDDHYYSREGYAVGNASSNYYISSHAYRLPSYHGRVHLRAPSNQVLAAQQLPTFTSHHGHISNMTPSDQSYYNWQYQQQHAYQSSRSSMLSTPLDHNSSTDSVATMAPLDMKPSSPASSVSEGNGYKPMADVSITLYPWTARVRNATLFTSTRHLSSGDEFGKFHHEGHDHEHSNDNQQLVEIRCLSQVDDLHQHDNYEDSDGHDSDNDESDDERDPAYAPNQTGNRLASLFDMPVATSNLRSKPTKSLAESTKVQFRLPAFPIAVPQRAAAKVATKRLTALTRPTTPEPQVKPDANDKVKAKFKASPPKKRVSRPRAGKKTKGKKRPLAVTSAALFRVPAPIVNFNIHKKSRGRAVTTDPNAVDSNIVHVCPVPACGACFKRREHVKRHIRGLHTEDKVSWWATDVIDCSLVYTTLSRTNANSPTARVPLLEATT